MLTHLSTQYTPSVEATHSHHKPASTYDSSQIIIRIKDSSN